MGAGGPDGNGLRQQLATAKTEEQFQTVGLLARETLISLAQALSFPTSTLFSMA